MINTYIAMPMGNTRHEPKPDFSLPLCKLRHNLSMFSIFVPGYDHRLCVVGLAPSHVALREEGGVTAVNFNVGKSDRSEMKVTGKRKRVSEL